MSLLNEMLNDLNESKSRFKASPTLIPKQKKSLRAWIIKRIPWLFHGGMLTLIVVLVTHLVQSFISTLDSKQLPSSVTASALTSSKTVPPRRSVIPPLQEKPPVMQKPVVLLSSIPAIPVLKNHTDAINNKSKPAAIEGKDQSHMTVRKVFNNLTPKQWQDLQLRKAMEALESGSEQHAVELMEGILNKYPSSIPARENLSIIWLSRGNTEKAHQLIDGGFTYAPYSLSLNIMKARLLFAQDKAPQALALLEKFNPDIQRHPDYYGLLAAIFQALGRINESGSIYKTLVKIEPSNSQYWLGYGIALESKHLNRQAVAAYQRASQGYDIDPEIRVYAEDKLRTLQG